MVQGQAEEHGTCAIPPGGHCGGGGCSEAKIDVVVLEVAVVYQEGRRLKENSCKVPEPRRSRLACSMGHRDSASRPKG